MNCGGGVERISIGDLDYSLDIQTGDEIEELAASMERMRVSLKAAMDRLKKQSQADRVS